MVFMGIDSYLHTRNSGYTAIDTIVQNDRHCIFDLVHLAVYRSNAGSVFKVSKMRQQLSYA
jgi:hypothetical protein